MGCDIHAIVEIKQNGKWCYIPDLPNEFDERSYSFFAMLNHNVRNSYGVHGFEAFGLPDDLSGNQFRFSSCKYEIEKVYNNKSISCCFASVDNFCNPYDEKLTVEIDMELYEHLCDGMTEEEKLIYYYPRHVFRDGRNFYMVQDARVIGGQFLKVPYNVLYPTLREFNDAYYRHPYIEEDDDYGYFDVDFFSRDYHSHSHLTLEQLKTKTNRFQPETKYIVDSNFIAALLEQIDVLPEPFVIIDEDRKNHTVTIAEDNNCDAYFIQQRYNGAVEKIEEIKKKYGIKDDANIRVVFAFDS